jgi:hypothetical protein
LWARVSPPPSPVKFSGRRPAFQIRRDNHQIVKETGQPVEFHTTSTSPAAQPSGRLSALRSARTPEAFVLVDSSHPAPRSAELQGKVLAARRNPA